VAIWTTDAVGSGDRFAYWQDVVCQTVLNVATRARPADFAARISGRSFGELRFASFESSSHEIIRGRRHLAQAPADNYLISLQRRGRSLIAQDDDAFALDAGGIAIVDGQKPFRVAFPDPVSRVLAVVPKKTLDRSAPWLRRAPFRRIAADAAFAALARDHLLQLATSELHEAEAHLLTDNLCNLLALATARGVPTDALRPDLQLQALLAFCRRHLGNPELSPPMAAARLGVSVRTVHLRFARLGQSFGRWLLENRLEAGSAALRDPRQRASGIAEIAYRNGFNDLSHFNKVFRARFGMTPGEWRRKA
jgi:AraC family transcriptional regulator, positive regulator of tynA and feaB